VVQLVGSAGQRGCGDFSRPHRLGRVTYHRIVGAILLYLLIAVAFGALFIFVGLSLPDAIKGITFEDNPALPTRFSI
jgi:hypothetical protein